MYAGARGELPVSGEFAAYTILAHVKIDKDRTAPHEWPAGERSSASVRRNYPIGAEVQAGGGTHFRVWAPRSQTVQVEILNPEGPAASTRQSKFALEAESDGYFSGLVADAGPGTLYKFGLDSGRFPDPASRFQPEGPHGASEVVDPAFPWTDSAWKGLGREGQVIYEMHIGTFTPEGTWESAMRELRELARLGITTLEVMPVADFSGRFGWGYDGVDLFAPTRLYGRPESFRAFVNRAHELGLGVILDVVYNHTGPDGNYLKEFALEYFTNRYKNEWGEALNFDGRNSGPVREFFIANAGYWIEEFHIDGLRLDATQQIFDATSHHILECIGARVRQAAAGRRTYIVAENEPQHTRLVRPVSEGGYGLDALWNDDFHHSARVALTGRREAYYSDYRGSPQEFISAVKWGYLYQGQWYSWQKQRRGASGLGLHPACFVNCIQNHDQVANSLRGQRIHQVSGPERVRALTALLLLGPGTPMLFQGQEFGASAPFLYFADHKEELAKLVAKGRREYLAQFSSLAQPESVAVLPDPGSERTFQSCILDLNEREAHPEWYRLHQDLIALRRKDPVFSQCKPGGVDGAVLGPEGFVLRFFGGGEGDRLLVVNLGADLRLDSIAEPLLAPMEGCGWKLIWSSEHPHYGGSGTETVEWNGRWRLLAHAAVVFAPEPADSRAAREGNEI